tara:strand:+ start:374 stop:655 length:282 start_codon:yes stop_codon:yes gene_type:complete
VVFDSFILILFLISFVAIAEIIYWASKKEYLESKSIYLRELINQKNNLSDVDHSFSSCVYLNWDKNGMDLSKAYLSCMPTNKSQSDYYSNKTQ